MENTTFYSVSKKKTKNTYEQHLETTTTEHQIQARFIDRVLTSHDCHHNEVQVHLKHQRNN